MYYDMENRLEHICNKKKNTDGERQKGNLELGSDRIFIHVNIVLVNRFHDEFVTLTFHPSGDKGSEIKPGIAIKHQLITDYLISSVFGHGIVRHLEPVSRCANTIMQS